MKAVLEFGVCVDSKRWDLFRPKTQIGGVYQGHLTVNLAAAWKVKCMTYRLSIYDVITGQINPVLFTERLIEALNWHPEGYLGEWRGSSVSRQPR